MQASVWNDHIKAEIEQLIIMYGGLCPADVPQAPQMFLRKSVHCLNHIVEI